MGMGGFIGPLHCFLDIWEFLSLLEGGRPYLDRRDSEHQIVAFGGINFDPLFTKFTIHPVGGSLIVVPVVETLIAPLARFTILSQIDGARSRRMVAEILREHGGWKAVFIRADPGEWMAIKRKVDKLVREEGGYKAMWDGNSISIHHRLAFYWTNFVTYFGFKSILQAIDGGAASSSLDPVAAFTCGLLSALTACFVSHPLDTMRARIAAQSRRNRRDDGFGSLYAGLLPALLGTFQSLAATVFVYESLSIPWRSIRPKDSGFIIGLVCSSLASIAASTVSYPMEVLKRRMQTEGREESNKNTKSMREMHEEIVEKEGEGAMYRGIRPHCLKVVTGHVVAFVTYEVVQIPLALAAISLAFKLNLYD